MAIHNPSQYDCDNMEPGDIVYVCERSWLYNLIRKLFYKDKLKLKIKLDLNKDEYKVYYQEDCTILSEYDLKCVQTYENEVPFAISTSPSKHSIYFNTLKTFKMGLLNTQLIFNNDITITIPTNIFENAIKSNEHIIRNIDTTRMVRDNLRFATIKSDTLRTQITKKHLRKYKAAFCPVCGKPLVFTFKKDKVDIKNTCECGDLSVSRSTMSYDELALWYNSATSRSEQQRNKEYWFGENANE